MNKGLLNQDIVVYNKTALDKYGRNSYSGGSTTVKARFQLKTINRLLPNRETVVVEAIAYVMPNTSINVGDKVTYSSVDYKVFGKNAAIDDVGSTDHIKLELTKWI